MRNKLDLPTLRGAWWALWALRRSRRELRLRAVTEVKVTLPPPLPWSATRGVRAVLRRRDPTCLERSLVLQAWEAAQGYPRSVVIGVRGTGEGMQAHAWLDGDPGTDHLDYHELLRVPAW